MAKRHRSAAAPTTTTSLPICGLVMPISDAPGYPPNHWRDVRNILIAAAMQAGYSARLVSESDDTRVIQDAIVKNLYRSEIVVVDVSSKNPNVLFELGMRLTFDKPVVIVKDDRTDYIFDVANIYTISYPAELRYQEMANFKDELANRIKGTVARSKQPDYSTFLKQFQIFDYDPKLDVKHGGKDDLILNELRVLQGKISALQGVLSTDGIVFPRSVSRMQSPSFGEVMSALESAVRDNRLVEFSGYDDILKDAEKVIAKRWTLTAAMRSELHNVFPELLKKVHPHIYDFLKPTIPSTNVQETKPT